MSIETLMGDLIAVLTKNNELLAQAAAERGKLLGSAAVKTAEAASDAGETEKPKRTRKSAEAKEEPKKADPKSKDDGDEVDPAAITEAIEAGDLQRTRALVKLAGVEAPTKEHMTAAVKAFMWVEDEKDRNDLKAAAKRGLSALGESKYGEIESAKTRRKAIGALLAYVQGEPSILDAEDAAEDDDI